MMEQVNHPQHYNARPDGLECIDIIRHYTFNIGCAIKYLWRAGLKGGDNSTEQDLRKAIFYIEDELHLGIELDEFADMTRESFDDLQDMLKRMTGRDFQEVANYEYYGEHLTHAMSCLLHVGLVSGGRVYRVSYASHILRDAIAEIKNYINELKQTTDLKP